MDRVKRERFNSVHSIELIRMYLRLDTTQELDNSWLSAEEIEEAEERALFIFRERLESEDWGLMKDFN